MWQQQGSETGMSLVPLKIVLALLILGVGVLMYGSHCQWRQAAENAAMAGAERLAAAKYGDMVVHLEPAPEWGAIISGAKGFMRNRPYMVWFPGMCIIIAALSISLIGDGLRDALDPRLKS